MSDDFDKNDDDMSWLDDEFKPDGDNGGDDDDFNDFEGADGEGEVEGTREKRVVNECCILSRRRCI
jgi:hypothetical protein